MGKRRALNCTSECALLSFSVRARWQIWSVEIELDSRQRREKKARESALVWRRLGVSNNAECSTLCVRIGSKGPTFDSPLTTSIEKRRRSVRGRTLHTLQCLTRCLSSLKLLTTSSTTTLTGWASFLPPKRLLLLHTSSLRGLIRLVVLLRLNWSQVRAFSDYHHRHCPLHTSSTVAERLLLPLWPEHSPVSRFWSAAATPAKIDLPIRRRFIHNLSTLCHHLQCDHWQLNIELHQQYTFEHNLYQHSVQLWLFFLSIFEYSTKTI